MRPAITRASLRLAVLLSSLARYPLVLPLAGIALGALLPGLASLARAALPVAVTLPVALAVLATEMTAPSREEVAAALLIYFGTAILGPLIAAGVSRAVGLPVDLAVAVVLLAAAPVAPSAGLLAQAVGSTARPVIWAALLGVLTGPIVLPIGSALCGLVGPLGPGHLACRAALSGLAPALLAFAVRRGFRRIVAAALPALRGGVLVTLLPTSLAAGGRLHACILATSDAGTAEALCLTTLLAAAVVAALTGRAAGTGKLLPFAIAGSARNASFAWAAAAGSLSTRAELILATAAVATSLVSAALRTAFVVMGRLRRG